MNTLQKETAGLLFEIMKIESIRINSGEIDHVEPIYVNGLCGSVYRTSIPQMIDGEMSTQENYTAVVTTGNKDEWLPSEADIDEEQEDSTQNNDMVIPEDKKALLIEMAEFFLRYFGVEESDEFVGINSNPSKRDIEKSESRNEIISDLTAYLDYYCLTKELGDNGVKCIPKRRFYSNFLEFTNKSMAEVSIKQLGRIMREMHFCDKRMKNELCWLFGKKK